MQTSGAATRAYGRPGSRASRIVARVVVAALLIGLPCEITFAQAFGEPYPALFQPRFEGGPATNNVATASSLTITVEFRSGPSEQISRDQLMSSIDPGLAGFVFKSMFGTQESAGSAGTAAWLGPRLSQLFPGRDASGILLVQETWKFDTRTGNPIGPVTRQEVRSQVAEP